MSVIKLDDVSKLYGFGDATTLALDEVNLTIEPNEFVAIMGPSGCGKSTLMHIIGLLDRPTHGTYMLNEKHVSRLNPNKRAKIRRDTIGFIFQSYNLLPRLTVLENVALPLAYKGLSGGGMTSGKQARLAHAMLERVGLGDRTAYYPGQLSGGQVQCVAIARALVNEPQLIIADEPTGNLDSAGSRLIMELLSEIHKSGNTILFVTHNPELTRYASRVVYMHDGSIVQDEATKFGQVAPTALRQMYHTPAKTAEDDLAGVSALMKAFPQVESAPRLSKPTKRTPKSIDVRPAKPQMSETRRGERSGVPKKARPAKTAGPAKSKPKRSRKSKVSS